ncbi:MAG: hypothetical protein JW931_00285 [Methanomicrobiaceae archaeon]|nr:hypothetical protein [Methanomicrobiaceae archaeon]
MNLNGAAKGLDQVFYIILFGILVFFSLVHLFAFIINWEGWFFGIRMAGLNAGIILFIFFLVPAVLAYLLYTYPLKTAIIAFLSTIFFSFTFLSSSITIREISGGMRSYNEFMAIFVVIPLIALAGHTIVSCFYDREECYKRIGNEKQILKPGLKNEHGEYSICRILFLAVAAFVIVSIFGMMVLIPTLLLLGVLFVISASKRCAAGETTKDEGLYTNYVQLLLAMAIMMIFFIILLYIIPVFLMLVFR